MRCQEPEGQHRGLRPLEAQTGAWVWIVPKLEPVRKGGFEPRQHLVREL